VARGAGSGLSGSGPVEGLRSLQVATRRGARPFGGGGVQAEPYRPQVSQSEGTAVTFTGFPPSL